MVHEEVNNSDLDNAVYRLENVLKYLDIEYKETRRGEKYVQINYIPVTSPQSQNPEFVNVRYNNDVDLPMLNEANSNYPDFDLDKNIRYQDTVITNGMWRYTGKESGGAGVYRNLNNDQFLSFDRSDFDIFRN